jgi:TonB family protein
MTIKRRALIARWRKQRNRPASSELNLLDLPKPIGRTRNFVHWPILAALILIHGALLIYLTAFLRMPRQGAENIAPQIIPVELATLEPSEALAKGDRQDVRSSSTQTVSVQVQADFSQALDEEIKTSLTVEAPHLYSAPLPEDAAIRSVSGSVSATPNGTNRAPAESPPIDQAIAHAEFAEESEENAGLTARAVANIPQEHADLSGQIWPEDAGLFSSIRGAATAPPAYPNLKDERFLQGVALQETSSLPAIPVPPRRAFLVEEIEGKQTTNLKASSGSERNEPSSSRKNAPSVYRAKVRAHLAGYKPNGGFGRGLVVVRFTLSPSGKVMAARIIRSSGEESLNDRVLDAVHRSEPYPEAPDSISASQRRFVIPFSFE